MSSTSRPHFATSRRIRRILIWLLLLAGCALAFRVVLRSPEATAGERLEGRAAALSAHLDLARADVRYLVLDPERGTLTLFHGGALLRSWPLTGVRTGGRRWLPSAGDWRGGVWSGARLEPPVRRHRQVVVSDSVEAPDPSGAETWIPPTPDEAVPAPASFVIHYQGRLGLEVRAARASPGDSVTLRPGFFRRTTHTARRWLPLNWDRYRVEVTMPAVEAAALYRSLPDSSALVVVLPRD